MPATFVAPETDAATRLQEQIVEAIKTVFDPEIPVDIYELGLIYDVTIHGDGTIKVNMTLTSPSCPSAGVIPPEVKAKIETIPGITNADVEVVWDPPWSPEKMSEAARLELGFM